eukprot:16429440-Heterocapsa_arctica.AAC.1
MMRMRMRRILNSWDMIAIVVSYVDADDEDDQDLKSLTCGSRLYHVGITVGSQLEHFWNTG